MKHLFPFRGPLDVVGRSRCLPLWLGLLLCSGMAHGQAPTVTTLSPGRNALTAPRSTPVTVGFSQPLSASTATTQALRVFSQQAGGRKAGTATVSSNTLTFTPSTAFKPGETVFATVTPGVQSSSGQSLAAGQVFQFTTATAPSPGTFSGSQQVPVGVNPVKVALADLDNDGDVDLLALNRTNGSLSVRLNNGQGTFIGTPGSEVSVGGNPGNFVLGDVDGDGDLDLLATTYQRVGINMAVVVLLNNGQGGFTCGARITLRLIADQLVLGDVDADGDLDVVVSAGSVEVYVNNGQGVFTSASVVPISLAGNMVLGDMDSDGDLDLLTTDFDFTTNTRYLRLNRNNGLGNFGSGQQVAVTGAGKLLVGDVDGDGDLDLVTSDGVRLNDGSGTFGSPTQAGLGGTVLGDVDGDGDLDLLAPKFDFTTSSATVSVRLNNGAGTFSGTQEVPTGNTSVTDLALADLDGDGDLDLAASASANSTSNGTVSIRLNQNLPAPVLTSVSPGAGPVGSQVVIRGDYFLGAVGVTFNGILATSIVPNSPTQLTVTVPAGASTGLLVVTTAAGTSNSLYFTVSLSLLATTPPRSAPSVPRTTAVAVTVSQPLDPAAAAGRPLKVFSAQAGGLKAGTTTSSGNRLTFTPTTPFRPGETVLATLTPAAQSALGTPAAPQVFQFTTAAAPSTGTFVASPATVVGEHPRAVTVGDVDGDGDVDLLTANEVGTVSIRLNDGTGLFTGSQEVAVGGDALSLALGDVDGDGDLDLVAGRYSQGSAVVLLNNGRGVFGSPRVAGSTSNVVKVALADMDGDGDLDLLLLNSGSFSSVIVLFNNSQGLFSTASNVRVGDSPQDLAVGDVDGDGDLDLITANSGTSIFGAPEQVSIRLNQGDGTFTTGPLVLIDNARYNSLELGDLDGDGDLDLLLSTNIFDELSNYYGVVEVLRNNGSGTFSNAQTLTGAANTVAYGLTLGDVDGDRDLDLAFFSAKDTVSMRLNNGVGSFSIAPKVPLRASNSNNLVLADVNADGTLDLLTTDYGSQTASISLNQPATAPPTAGYRLNAGGGTLSTTRGVFAADQYYYPSSTYAVAVPIAGTTDDALYQSERYSTNGTLSYALPVANGTYSVVLHFAETYWTQPGQRVFNIGLEGNTVRTNYDIIAKVGPLTATTETFAVTVADGVLNLDLVVPYLSGGRDQAKLSALEVILVSPAPAQAPVANAGLNQLLTLPTNRTILQGSGVAADSTRITYAWTQVQGPTTAAISSPTAATPTISGLVAGSYVFQLIVTDGTGARSIPSLVTVTVYPATTGPVAYRINVGGSALSTTRGPFAADQFYVGASKAFTVTGPLAPLPIGGTADPALYQSERYSTDGVLRYALPVSNGTYTLVLHFAEIYWQQVGQRVFDVTVEGNKVLDHYDIVRKVGPRTATTETFTVVVNDGVLNLDLRVPYLTGGADQAKLSAIEVLSAASGRGALAASSTADTRLGRAVEVYPNPTTGLFTLAYSASKAQAGTLTLVDPLGRTVHKQQVSLQVGANHVLVQPTQVRTGLYQVVLRTADGQRLTQKVLVQP